MQIDRKTTRHFLYMLMVVYVFTFLAGTELVISGPIAQMGQALPIVGFYLAGLWRRKTIKLYEILFLTLGGLLIVYKRDLSMISLPMFVMLFAELQHSFKRIDFLYVVKRLFFFALIIFWAIVLAYFTIGFGKEHDVNMWRIDHMVFRASLGFVHANQATMMCMSVFLLGFAWYAKTRNIILLAAVFGMTVFVVSQTQSRTTFYSMCVIAAVGLLAWAFLRSSIGIARYFLVVMVLGVFAWSYYLLTVPPEPQLNNLLSGRITLWQTFYHRTGIHFLGTPSLEYAMFDNGYLQMMLSKGLYFLVLFMSIQIYLITSMKKMTVATAIAFAGYLIVGVTETSLLHFDVFIPVLLAYFISLKPETNMTGLMADVNQVNN
ncbi:MAG: hypothetical protein LBT37_00160 [Lactobacillaceae bacterium]|nr:hypothetical protein [Lactobacillaceae bacterium]